MLRIMLIALATAALVVFLAIKYFRRRATAPRFEVREVERITLHHWNYDIECLVCGKSFYYSWDPSPPRIYGGPVRCLFCGQTSSLKKIQKAMRDRLIAAQEQRRREQVEREVAERVQAELDERLRTGGRVIKLGDKR